MNRSIKTTLFILAISLLFGCSSEALRKESAVSENETAPAYEQLFDIDDIFASDSFTNIFRSVIADESYPEYDLSEAYIGTPYLTACYDSNGVYSTLEWLSSPLICNDKVITLISTTYRDDGTYDCGADPSCADKLNELIENGKEYVIVFRPENICFAISEDNELHLLYDYTYSDETDLSPDITFEEASKFGNVISLESLTTKVYP